MRGGAERQEAVKRAKVEEGARVGAGVGAGYGAAEKGFLACPSTPLEKNPDFFRLMHRIHQKERRIRKN